MNTPIKRNIDSSKVIRKSNLSTTEHLDPSSRQISFTISTDAQDSSNDVIDQNGWDSSTFKTNPIVLWNHNQDLLPVGKCVSIGLVDGKLKAVVEFATADLNPHAEQVFQLIKNGFISATSVGFRPIDFEETKDPARGGGSWQPGIDFKKQELFEFSIVNVPSNPEAIIDKPIFSPKSINNASEDKRRSNIRRIKLEEARFT